MTLPPAGPGTHVLVTGASSGIGAAVARVLGDRGYPTVLVARREEELTALAATLPAARVLPADLADDAERATVREVVGDDHRIVGVVNAAGFGAVGRLADLAQDAPEKLDRLVRLNVLALHDLTTAAVGALVRRGGGAILNVSSVGAFQPVPGSASYAASKAFVQSFSEAVHAELAGTGVSLTTVSPGVTSTEFGEAAGTDLIDRVPSALTSTPASVAEAGVAAMAAGHRTVVPGLINQVGAIGGRLAPRSVLLPAINAALDWT